MGRVRVVYGRPWGGPPATSLYHSVNPESWFASTPGLKIVAPITAYDAKGLIKAAIRDNNPVLFLEYKAHYRTDPRRLALELNLAIPDRDYVVPIGVARVVREGSALSLITYGSHVLRALAAAGQLRSEDGVSVQLIDPRTLLPCAYATIPHSLHK